MDKNIGKRLDGRYEINELIGVGGMADVYKGHDLVDNRVVAIKILKKEFSENEEFLRRFRNESKAIAVLSHPNIVKIYDVGFTEKIQYIIMEHIDGITLKEYMENEKVLNWKDSAHFIIQILRALQHAHDRGIFHRDIKPQNIMMFTDGTIKVMDFGIAKFAREDGKTATNQAIGSVHYISPEQAMGEETDSKSDIYSVGIMLYEMLTGQKPFDTDNPVSIAVMHMQSNAKRPRDVNPDILVGLEEIILKAIEKETSKRYQSASEMIRDIEKVKANPEVVFGYYTSKVNAGGFDTATRFFKTVAPTDGELEDDEYYDEDADDYDEDDDGVEYEEEEAKSIFFPILSAVTIVVILVAAFFVTKLVQGAFGDDNSAKATDISVGDLVGLTLDEARDKYSDLNITMTGSAEYSDYEADVIFWQDIEADKKVKKGTEVKVKISKGKQKVKVPNVIGFNFSQAQGMLERDGLVVSIQYATDEEEKNNVFKTEPEAQAEVDKGSTVILYVSQGNSNEVEVSKLIGKTIEKARKECEETLELVVKTEDVNSSEPEGTVVGQSISAGTRVATKTTITLQVSTGVPATSKVKINFDIPSDATGRFIFSLYVNGSVVKQSDVVNVAYTGSVDVEVEGSGTQEVTAELKNATTGATAKIGVFKVNFESGTMTVINENTRNAFSSVGGLETKPPTTEPPTTEPPKTEIPKTEPPATEPPVTEPPVTEPPVTDDGDGDGDGE
ncbi:MAG TPA: Stk1 family PASTA domain-containing Ser/Thr kinase [Clostridiales bacterium]|nr:Stk1 family PASTA domain-containing Ser/Thr kinase [Clostridiales bacterium]